MLVRRAARLEYDAITRNTKGGSVAPRQCVERIHQGWRSGTEVGASSVLAADATGELDILGHDRDALGVDCARIRILKDAHEVRLCRLLQSKEGL